MQSDPTHRTGWPFSEPTQPAPLPPTLPDGSPWPRISIVTPSFNQGRYIEQTILSVLHQDYPNIEYIVMDGGSKDETVSILDKYRSHLAHAASEKDRGQSHAINKGMALATGDIVTWLNSDDLLAPGALAAAAMAFHASGADMIAGICRLYKDGQYVGGHLTSCLNNEPLPLNDLLDLDHAWNAGQFFYQPETMYTRALWLKAGGQVDESLYYSMDYELWLRYALAGAKLHVIGRPIAHFRMHDEQKTSTPEKFKTELVAVRDNFVRKNNLSPTPVNPRSGAKHSLRANAPEPLTARALATAGHHVTIDPSRLGCDVDLTDVATGVVVVSPEFQPVPKRLAREMVGLPPDAFLVATEVPHLEKVGAIAPGAYAIDAINEPILRKSLLLAAADLFVGSVPQNLAEARACCTCAITTENDLSSAIQRLRIGGDARQSIAGWGYLQAANEHSQAAVVHQIHNALTRKGVADKVPIARKIGFTPTPAPISFGQAVFEESVEFGPGFGPWQEADAKKGLPRCRWALGPTGRLDVLAARPGRRRVSIACLNFESGQSLEVAAGGRSVATLPVPVAKKGEHRLSVQVNVLPGRNELELRYAKGTPAAPGKPPRAILITRVSSEPAD